MTELVSLIFYLAIIILGLATGAVSNVTSGGAGVFTIFVLSRFGTLSIQDSVGTVLASSTIFVLVGAITFYRKRLVDVQLSLTLGLAGVAGAFFAARLASTIQSTLVERSLGAFTLLVAGYSIYRIFQLRGAPGSSVPNGEKGLADPKIIVSSRWSGRNPSSVLAQIGIGTMIGLATGLFGVGGGGLTMAVLLFAFKLKAKLMLGTSLMASFFRYAGGSLGYLTTGNIDPTVFLDLAITGGIGSLVGARMVFRQAKDSYIQMVVVLLLLFVGIEFLI